MVIVQLVSLDSDVHLGKDLTKFVPETNSSITDI